jgi:hypothetical protein
VNASRLIIGLKLTLIGAACSFSAVSRAQSSAISQSSTAVNGQAAVSTTASTSDLETILQQRRALFLQERALRAQGDNQQALQAWYRQHATELAAVNQKLKAWSEAQPQPSVKTSTYTPVLAGATPEMNEFLANRTQLINSRRQSSNTSDSTIQTRIDSTSMSRNIAIKQGQQQNGALLNRQQELASIISQQQEQIAMKNPSATPIFPSNASPQLKAFLTARNQLTRGLIQTRNQYASADPKTRKAAMKQWRQQNAALFQQLQQQEQALAQSNPSVQN